MTNDELDKARAHEAWRIATTTSPHNGFEVGKVAARLAREGWTPTDPDMIEARRIACGSVNHIESIPILAGECDGGALVNTAMRGIKRGRQLERGSSANVAPNPKDKWIGQ